MLRGISYRLTWGITSAIGAAALALLWPVSGEAKLVYGCRKVPGGDLRIVAGPGRCAAGERQISWTLALAGKQCARGWSMTGFDDAGNILCTLNAYNRGNNLDGLSQEGADLSDHDFAHSSLRWASLAAADLERANMTGADLREADLSSANLAQAKLERSLLGGADLGNANLWEADLNYADVTGATLAGAVLESARLDYLVGFTGAQLRSASSLRFCSMPRNLAGIDLSGVNLSEVSMRDSDLAGADLSGANLSYANLWKATGVTAAQLRSAASLVGIIPPEDLTGFDLSGLDLTNANLYGHNLTGASLLGATMAGANVTDVIWSNTTCPDGTNSSTNGTWPESCIGHGGGL